MADGNTGEIYHSPWQMETRGNLPQATAEISRMLKGFGMRFVVVVVVVAIFMVTKGPQVQSKGIA